MNGQGALPYIDYLIIETILAMQCDRGTSYKPCISTCKPKTCDNLHEFRNPSQPCHEEPCVEGCAPEQCERGKVYESDQNLQVKHIR